MLMTSLKGITAKITFSTLDAGTLQFVIIPMFLHVNLNSLLDNMSKHQLVQIKQLKKMYCLLEHVIHFINLSYNKLSITPTLQFIKLFSCHLTIQQGNKSKAMSVRNGYK